MAEQIDSRVELIQALIPLGLDAVKDLLQKEVKALAGERYRRGGSTNRTRPAGRVRWGRQRGSVYLADQKLPIQVPCSGFGIAMRDAGSTPAELFTVTAAPFFGRGTFA